MRFHQLDLNLLVTLDAVVDRAQYHSGRQTGQLDAVGDEFESCSLALLFRR